MKFIPIKPASIHLAQLVRNRKTLTQQCFVALVATLCLGWFSGFAVLRTAMIEPMQTSESLRQAFVPPKSFQRHRQTPAIKVITAMDNATLSLMKYLDSNPKDIPVIIIIASATPQFEQRQAIRETWGNRSELMSQVSRRIIGPLFFVGTTEASNLVSFSVILR